MLVTFSPSQEIREEVRDRLARVASISYLPDLDDDARADALAQADVLLSWSIDRELRGDELTQLESVGLVQLLSAGVDHVPFAQIPDAVPVASNAGAYADPMAEHVLAMALALAKRLPQNHAALTRGEFDQQTPTRAIRGCTAGILGFGGIGQACARLFTAFGAHIHALNRSGHTDQPVDWIGTLGELDALLASADILVISLPLSRETRGLIARRELELMKPDAILVNVARAAIIDEDALYEHLRRNPSFSAGIDTWWQEPQRAGTFATRRPLLELPNLLGSPHNSGITPGTFAAAAGAAAENIARHLRGEPVQHLVRREDYAARD